MDRRRRKLLAGGLASALAGLVVATRRRRRSPTISKDLVEKAESWVSDADLPEHVRDVARRILDLNTPAAVSPARRFGRSRG